MIYRAGTRMSVMIVAKRTPKARLTTIGIRNLACRLDSKSIGVKPRNVVSVVRRMGRKRRMLH